MIEHSSHHDTTCCEGWAVSDVIDHAEVVLAMVDNIDGESSISKDKRLTGELVEELKQGIEFHDERFRSLVDETAEIRHHWKGSYWSEGAGYLPHENVVVWSDIPNNRMLQYDPETGQTTVFREPSNFTNGNTTDREGRMVTATHLTHCISRTELDGTVTVLVDRYQGKRLNSPNDVVVKSDGTIWFTDPPYGILSDYEGYPGEQEYGGCNVFSFDPKLSTLKVMIDDLDRPNGIAISPDEKKLYVADTGENIKHLYVYDMVDGLPINRKLIYDFKPFFSDGFRCDKDGNVWTSAGKAIKCFNPQNELIGQLIIPELVSNLEFGGVEGNILYITATTSLYSIELNQQGARFYE